MAVLWSIALADRVNLLKTEAEDANRALRNSEYRLSQILEGLPLGVVVYGKDQTPSYLNRRVIDILSNPSRSIQPDLSAGRTLEQAMEYFDFRVAGTNLAYPLDNMPVYRALLGEPASADDIEANLADKRVPLEIWASPVKDDTGSVESAVVAFQDITRRRQTEAELAANRQHLESLVDVRTAELNATNDQLQHEVVERKFLEGLQAKLIRWLSEVNQVHQSLRTTADLPRAYEYLMAVIMELLEARSAYVCMWPSGRESLTTLCYAPQDDSGHMQQVVSNLLLSDSRLRESVDRGELLVLSTAQARQMFAPQAVEPDSETLESVVLVPAKIGESVTGLLGLELTRGADDFHDEEADLLDRMAFDIAHLTEYADYLDQARELAAAEERNRLARDLHDSVTQVLFSASLVAEVLPRIWQRDQQRALQSVERLQQLTHGALAEMRTMLLELRPAALVKTPLAELLAQLTEAATTRTGLSFQLAVDQVPPLPEAVHIGFYRIAQEALNNVVKHAQANLVTVSLSATPLRSEPGSGRHGTGPIEVTMVIHDDGIGFTKDEADSGHLGMGIMRERASAVGATLSMESRPGYGTRVTLNWCDKSEVDND